MSQETILLYVTNYGYFIMFLFLFCGIVGIPAPEETLLFLIGILVGEGVVDFSLSILISSFGVFVGMVTAYGIGRTLGIPFIKRFGKLVGINPTRWRRAKRGYLQNGKRIILVSLFLPGLRQVSPYFAGVVGFPMVHYVICAIIMAIIWCSSLIVLGYLLGEAFQVHLSFLPLIGLVLLLLFFLSFLIKKMKKKRG